MDSLWSFGARGGIRAKKILSCLRRSEVLTLPEIISELSIHPRYHSAYRKLIERMVDARIVQRWNSHEGVAHLYGYVESHPTVLIRSDADPDCSDVIHLLHDGSEVAILSDRGAAVVSRWVLLEPEPLFGIAFLKLSDALQVVLDK